MLLLAVGQSQVWVPWSAGGVGGVPHAHRAARAALIVGFVVPLAWRRVRPLWTVTIICAAIVVQLLTVATYVPFLVGLLPMAVANYTAAAYGPPRLRAASLAAVFAAEAVIYAKIAEERTGGEVLFALFVMAGTWIVGDVVRARLVRADQTVAAAQTLVAASEAAAGAALAEERARIARELHDVIAHSVSVMGVQAGAARTMIDTDPDAARDALRSVEATARSSVGELQRLLAVLRDQDGADTDRAPQPGLSQLPALVEQVRTAGLPVELSVTGTAALPAGVDLAAYRIVQEALTNALKHARARTEVTVECSAALVRIEVRDAGAGHRRPRNAAGHGLVGMRERAQLYGGTVHAGPHPDGGFVVRACLPVGSELPS
jgi:signal transduction histidine kinase